MPTCLLRFLWTFHFAGTDKVRQRNCVIKILPSFRVNFWSDLPQNPCFTLEEDKGATSNVQNGLVSFFLFPLNKALILREVLGEIVWKSAKECENDERFCPVVVALYLPFSFSPIAGNALELFRKLPSWPKLLQNNSLEQLFL